MQTSKMDEFERIRLNLMRGLAPSTDDGIFLVRELEMLREAAQAVVGEWNSPHHLRAERDEAVEPLIATLGAALVLTNREET